MRRVTLECPVLGAEELSDWARSGTNPGLGIDWDAPTNAHLTVLHLGRPAELHAEVTKARQSSAELPEQEFYTALLRWALQSCNLLKHAARVHVDSLRTLGESPPYALAAIALDLPPELADLHSRLLDSLEDFAERLFDVPDGSALVESSKALGFSARSWLPHITVGWSARHLHLQVSPLEVRLGPLEGRHLAQLSGKALPFDAYA
jgi:hypothetical protein